MFIFFVSLFSQSLFYNVSCRDNLCQLNRVMIVYTILNRMQYNNTTGLMFEWFIYLQFLDRWPLGAQSILPVGFFDWRSVFDHTGQYLHILFHKTLNLSHCILFGLVWFGFFILWHINSHGLFNYKVILVEE